MEYAPGFKPFDEDIMAMEFDLKENKLYTAIAVEDIKQIKGILKRKDAKSMLEETNLDGSTPLIAAVSLGNTEIVRLLISAGANVNAQDEYYKATALHKTCLSGNLELAKVLVDNGADSTIKDIDGQTPLEYLIDLCNNNRESTKAELFL